MQHPLLPGFAEMTEQDIPAVTKLFNTYQSRFAFHQTLSEAEVRHTLMPKPDVVYTYFVKVLLQLKLGHNRSSD